MRILYQVYDFIENVKEPVESLLAFNAARSETYDWIENNLSYRIMKSRCKIVRIEGEIAGAYNESELQRFIEFSSLYLNKAKGAVEDNEFRKGYIFWYYSEMNLLHCLYLFDRQSQNDDGDSFEYERQKYNIRSGVENHLPFLENDNKESAKEILYKNSEMDYNEWNALLYYQIRGILNQHDEKTENSNKQDSIIRRLGYFVFVSLISLFLICLFPIISVLYPSLSPPVFGAEYPHLFFYVPVFGILGASFFGLITERQKFDMEDYSKEAPGRFRFWFAIARITVGAVAAMATFIFIQSGILPSLIRVEQSAFTPSHILMLSFVAGYSERLLVDTLYEQTEMITSGPLGNRSKYSLREAQNTNYDPYSRSR